jgi:DNA replication and repair protein RecF
MFLQEINLIGFKNYLSEKVSFSDHVNCILGENGMGKTNLLDAIHYLSLGKSAFNPIDKQNITHDHDFFTIQGLFMHREKKKIVQCSLKNGEKKKLSINKKIYHRIKEHVGSFPVVLISPYDTELINEGNEVRRKFFDNLLSQTDPAYLDDLIHYNRVLSQRNSLLKNPNSPDPHLISTYDDQLLELGNSIFRKRSRVLHDFLPLFQKQYEQLSGGMESVDIGYISDHQNSDFEAVFRNNFEKDRILQRTLMGVHRDRYLIRIDNYPAKKYGSQGQLKSIVIGMKLAQYEQIKTLKSFKPILLLDDIFDKLDDRRIQRLMDLVSGNFFGQLFITDARPERTMGVFKNLEVPHKIFQVIQGKIQEV